MNYRNDVVTSAPHEDIYETVMNGGDPKPFFNEVTMTCSCGCITMLHVTPFYLVVKKESDMDFAHDGQGFPSWHRLYLLAWERTLQEIGNDEEFALPFWDWTGNPNQCDPAIFFKEFLGVTDQTTSIVRGNYWMTGTSFVPANKPII